MSFGIETSDDLVAAVKRDCKIPNGQITYTDAQILAIAYEKLLEVIVPLLLSADEGWYRTSVDSSLTGGVGSYVLPKYSMFLKLYAAAIYNITTNEERMLDRADLADRMFYGYGKNGFPTHVYIEHNSVTLLPFPDAGTAAAYGLRFIFFRMPGSLVMTSAAAKVLSVNKATGVVTYTANPPATFTATSTHDFYSSTSPFTRIQNGITATAQAGATQTFPIPSVQNLNPGDYVNILDQTVYPDIPYGLFTSLKNLTIHSIASTQMDVQQSMEAEKKIITNAKTIIGAAPGNRFVSQYKKISQWNNALISTSGIWRNRGGNY